jgi:hypothetical protein
MEAWMTDGERGPVRVSRRIEAPAAAIFGLLADPRRHLDLDGSGMLRGVVSDGIVTGVGDVFVMQMYYSRLGDYQMDNHVVEFEPDRRIGWEPVAGHGHPDQGTPSARWGHRWSFELEPDGPAATVVTEIYDCSQVPEAESAQLQHGRVQVPAMERTLERLDELCAG